MLEIASHIILTGICLFVAPDKKSPPESVVFMDGRTDRTGGTIDPAMVHHVYLAIEDKDYTAIADPAGVVPERTVIGDGGRNFTVFTLDDAVITPLAVKQGSIQGLLPTVTHLSDVWPKMMGGAHTPNAHLREARRDPSLEHRVNSRLILAGGDVSVSYRNGDVWEFDPNVLFHATMSQAIPQEVRFNSTIIGGALALEIREASTLELKTAITITPKSGTDVTVLLANVPAADLFPTDTCTTEIDCLVQPDHACCTDHHFELYYDAFDSPPSKPPIPHKKVIVKTSALPQEVLLFRVGGANCGPAQQP
jgi:hypothetical protein